MSLLITHYSLLLFSILSQSLNILNVLSIFIYNLWNFLGRSQTLKTNISSSSLYNCQQSHYLFTYIISKQDMCYNFHQYTNRRIFFFPYQYVSILQPKTQYGKYKTKNLQIGEIYPQIMIIVNTNVDIYYGCPKSSIKLSPDIEKIVNLRKLDRSSRIDLASLKLSWKISQIQKKLDISSHKLEKHIPQQQIEKLQKPNISSNMISQLSDRKQGLIYEIDKEIILHLILSLLIIYNLYLIYTKFNHNLKFACLKRLSFLS